MHAPVNACLEQLDAPRKHNCRRVTSKANSWAEALARSPASTARAVANVHPEVADAIPAMARRSSAVATGSGNLKPPANSCARAAAAAGESARLEVGAAAQFLVCLSCAARRV